MSSPAEPHSSALSVRLVPPFDALTLQHKHHGWCSVHATGRSVRAMSPDQVKRYLLVDGGRVARCSEASAFSKCK